MEKLEENQSFLEALDTRLLIGDGAMGTVLQGLGYLESPDTLNMDEAGIRKVTDVHLAYLHAGADLIQTNTFSSNPVKLRSRNLEDLLVPINQKAVSAAREAIDLYRKDTGNDRKVFLGGNIGPLGVLMEPSGNMTYSQALAFFSQQVEILAASGIDAILIETMMDINEAYAATQAAKAIGLPVICSLTFGLNGRTMMGNKAEDSVALLQDKGADVVGANCSLGSAKMLEIVKKMRNADRDAKLIFQPNAGLPVLKDNKTVYDETPQIMAENISRYLNYNPSVVGACCGSTPEHIKKITELL